MKGSIPSATGIAGDPVAQLEQDGWCVVPDVLTRRQAAEARERLVAAAEESRRRGVDTYMPALDPNDRNIRVFNLLDLDPLFRELIVHARALTLVEALLGSGWMISNFTANVALPGSRSMALHSDQALVVPEPWLEPWSMNVIWCLDDVHADNGATRFLPGSHRCTRRSELPASPLSGLQPFEAPCGSIIAMDGRMWHTSGANVTASEERALLFGYYAQDFLRPQVNWNAVLGDAIRAQLSGSLFERLGLGPQANVRVAAGVLAAGSAGVE